MPKDFFHLVNKLRAAKKYFDIGIEEIRREISGGGKLVVEGEVTVGDGDLEEVVPISLRLAAPNGTAAWKVSILLHEKRIDCVDHELSYKSHEGTMESGFHRHMWDAKEQNCDKKKRPLQGFADEMNLEDFLNRVFSELGITVNKHDTGSYSLQFN